MKIKIKLPGCNLNCNYCPPSNRGGNKPINPEKITKFISASKENGINELQWSGGEPTIHKEFIPLVKFAKDSGFYQSLTTNGTCSPKYLYELNKVGISRVNISLDTLSPREFERITGKNLLDKVLTNIETASMIFDNVTKINTVITDNNINEVGGIYNYYKDNPKIIPRFIQLTYKGNEEFVDKHRLGVKEISEILPIKESEEMMFSNKEFTNPVAKYYKTKDNYIFSVIPQNHTCKSNKCNKIWYLDGNIFICKIDQELHQIDNNVNKTLAVLISQKCHKSKNPNGHRIRNTESLNRL